MVSINLRHWRLVEKISVEQAAFLIAGVDPFDLASAGGAFVARGRTFEIAIRQASERAFVYAHGLVHRLDQEPHDAWLVDIWEMSDEFDRYLPSLELRNSVAEVLRDPENVPLLVPVDPWFSETVYGGELNRWMGANDIQSSYDFPQEQAVVIRDRGRTSWAEWREERDEIESRDKRAETEPASRRSPLIAASWPWGSHDTILLRKLAAAAERFWVNYDPTDATTAPTNAQVIAWLRSQGVAERTAEVMATILRIDGLPTGPRKELSAPIRT